VSVSREIPPLSALLLSPIGGGGWGGTEAWMLALSKHLVGRGHRVTVCGRPGSRWLETCRACGCPAVELSMRGDFRPSDLWTLREVYRRHTIDLVVTKMRQCIRMAWAARLLAGGGGPAILCRMGNGEMKRSYGAKLTYRYMADRYVTPSEHSRRELLRYGYYGEERIRAIPNGVEIPPEDTTARERLRAELALGASRVLIVTGRLHPIKDHACLFDAFAALRRDFPDLRLLVVGDGAERATLEDHARRLGIDEAAVFTGFRTDVTDLLRAADIFVLPSLLEGMPHAVLEAMAVGLPVVASAVGGVPEVVAHGDTGLLVSAGDAGLLRGAIGRLLAEPELAAQMGRAGLERVRTSFTMERMLGESEACCLEARAARLRGH